MLIKVIEKEPSERFVYAINYQDLFRGAEVFSSVVLSATLESDNSNVSGSLLGSTNATIISGTVSHAGTTSFLIDSSKDFLALGVRPGHEVLNSTKKFRARIKEIKTSFGVNDTLVFESTAPQVSTVSDAYTLFLASATILPYGNHGQDFLITWTSTTSLGRVFVDTVRVKLRQPSVPAVPSSLFTSVAAGGDLAGTYPNPTVHRASKTFARTGIIRPPALLNNQNNYSPADLEVSSVIYLDPSTFFITGLSGGFSGREMLIVNISATNSLRLKHENTSSLPENRFITSDDADLVVGPKLSTALMYDGVTQRWRIVSAASGAPSGVQSVTGLNTDNTNPLNPIVRIAVDGRTVGGQGTELDPLVALVPTDLGEFTNGPGFITDVTGQDHNVLDNLASGDSHPQYAILAGRSGGQVLSGSNADSQNLTLQSTSTAIKGKIFLGSLSAYDELNTRFGLGTTIPTHAQTIDSVRFNRWDGTGSRPQAGLVGYHTADQTTNFSRVEFFADRFNAGVFNIQKGGTESQGFLDFRIQNTSVFQIDAANAGFYGNILEFSGAGNRTIGRYSGSFLNFREIYMGQVVSVNPALNVPPRANLEIRATPTIAGAATTATTLIQAYSGQTMDLAQWLNSAGTTLIKITSAGLGVFNAGISSVGAGSLSERFGAASLAGLRGSAFGYGAEAGQDSLASGYLAKAGTSSGAFGSVATGPFAEATSYYSTATGAYARCTSLYGTAVGYGVIVGYQAVGVGTNMTVPDGATWIGTGLSGGIINMGYNNTSATSGMTLGYLLTALDRELHIGTNLGGYRFTDLWLTGGKTASDAASYGPLIFHAVRGLGTNVAGQAMVMEPGASTGNVSGGSFIVKTAPAGASGTTLGTPVDRLEIDGEGVSNFKGKHLQTLKLKGGSTIPTIVVGPGAGTGATCSLTAGSNDLSGEIVFTTGATGLFNSSIITRIFFTSAYSSAPFITFTPSNNAAALIAASMPYAVCAAGTFDLTSNSINNLLPSTTYKFMYHAVS